MIGVEKLLLKERDACMHAYTLLRHCVASHQQALHHIESVALRTLQQQQKLYVQVYFQSNQFYDL